MGKGSLRRALVALSLLAALPALGGCAAPTSYAGIPLAPGVVDAEVQDLARRARSGDKQAQLELGIRYEEGRGVPADLMRARELYASAARTTGGTVMVTSPAVGRNGRTTTSPVSTGPEVEGLAAAQERLRALDTRAHWAAKDGEHLFDASDFAALARRFSAGIGHTGLTVYPGREGEECFGESRRRRSLARVLQGEMPMLFTGMPLSCLFSGYSPRELHELASRGNMPARFLYLSLIIEENGCADSVHADALARLSDAGRAIASIAMGNLLRNCGRPGAFERYLLAERQGFVGARRFYRDMLTNPPPPLETQDRQ